jgi:glutathione S-transferase
VFKKTGVQYIPVLQTPEDDVGQDTTVIIDHMEKRFPPLSVYPATARRKLAALILMALVIAKKVSVSAGPWIK